MRSNLLFILSFLCVNLFSQVNIHYFKNQIPQSNFLNPALHSSCKVVVGMPLLNGIGTQISHSGFTFNQLFSKNGDNTFSPNPDNALDKMGRKNYLQANIDLSDFFLSIKIKTTFYNFSIRDRVQSNIFYSKDIMSFLLEGNTPFEGDWATGKGSGAYFNYFRQYSLGFSKSTYSYLDIGAHVNLLFGKGNMVLNPKSFRFFTDAETFGMDLDLDIVYQSSLPLIMEYNQATDLRLETVDTNPVDILLNRDNKGISFDFGFVYDYYSDLKIFGSILDIGFIKYKRNITNFVTNGQFSYNGPPENEYLSNTYFIELANSIDDNIDVSLTSESYFNLLPARLYLGAEKEISEKFSAGVLSNVNIYNRKALYYLGAHASYRPVKQIDLLLSYSLSHRSFTNIGTGLSFNLNPLNIYFLTDNLAGYLWPRSAKNVNFQFGLNFIFGCKEKEGDIGCGCSWIKAPKKYQQNKDFIKQKKD